MAFKHGKTAVFKHASTDLSAFCNSVEFKRSADSHDTTTFGQAGHTYAGGLTDGTISVKGIYDDGASGTPKVVVEAALGTTVAIDYKPEGTGTGKPESTCNAVVTSYEESAPAADLISWSAEYQISGAVTVADQT